MTAKPEPYYRALGNVRFASTIHAQGAWNEHEQHMAPVAGLMAHSIESFQSRPELRTTRISYDILGLIPDVAVSDTARLIGLIDSSNGVATRVAPGPGSWAFPNVDLQLHLYREPTGEWLGLQNSVTFGSDGVGLTSTVLHDERGPFGRAEQTLTVRRT